MRCELALLQALCSSMLEDPPKDHHHAVVGGLECLGPKAMLAGASSPSRATQAGQVEG